MQRAGPKKSSVSSITGFHSSTEHTRVKVSVETLPAAEAERAEWLAQSERLLLQTWGNEADDVYNELLAR